MVRILTINIQKERGIIKCQLMKPGTRFYNTQNLGLRRIVILPDKRLCFRRTPNIRPNT